MPKVSVYNTAGEQVGEIELDEGIFGAEINHDLLHQAVVMYQARKRRGTAATKTRGLVAGGRAEALEAKRERAELGMAPFALPFGWGWNGFWAPAPQLQVFHA